MLLGQVPLPIRLLLPILWYGLIYSLTEYPGASSYSTQVFIKNLHQKVDETLHFPNFWLLSVEFWNGSFRIGSHLFMFGVLGILIYYLLEPSMQFVKKKYWTSIFFATLLGIVDEVHQSFVPDRFGLPIDVIKDAIGAFIFVSAVCLIKKLKLTA